MSRRIFALFALLTVVTTARSGQAETPTPTQKGAPVVWREVWPRFRLAEMAFTGGMALVAAMALFLYPAPKTGTARSSSTNRYGTPSRLRIVTRATSRPP